MSLCLISLHLCAFALQAVPDLGGEGEHCRMAEVETGHGTEEKKSMTEKVKGALGGLLGGKKHHPQNELPHTLAGTGYESTDTHNTRDGNVGILGFTEGQNQAGYEGGGNVFENTGTGPDSYGTGTHRVGTDFRGPGTQGTGPQGVVGKFEEVIGHPGDHQVLPEDGAVENFNQGKAVPKVDNSYETWINEGRSRNQTVSTGDVPGQKGIGHDREQAERDEQKSQPQVYGDVTDGRMQSGTTRITDILKDAVTGQTPSHGIATGTATSGDGRTKTAHGVVQDVGIGSNVFAGTARGNFDRERSEVPGHNPHEDEHVLDGHNTDSVDRLRETVIGDNFGNSPENAIAYDNTVTGADHGGLPMHRRPIMSGATNPQGGATLGDLKDREQGPRADNKKNEGPVTQLMDGLHVS